MRPLRRRCRLPHAPAPFSSVRWLLSDFSPVRFDPRNTCTLYRDRAANGRIERETNYRGPLINNGPSLPIGNNVPRGLLIAGRIISMPRRTGILPLPWTLLMPG